MQVSTRHIDGGVLLQSASVHDFDQREMFYMYLSPGDIQSKKVCAPTANFQVYMSCYVNILMSGSTPYAGIQKGHYIRY